MNNWRVGTAVISCTILTGMALANPLFIGEQEVDTADETAIAEIIELCERRGQEADDAETAMRFTVPSAYPTRERLQPVSTLEQLEPRAATSSGLPAPSENSIPLSIEPKAISSSDGGGEAAGEGSGPGPAPEESDATGPKQEDGADLDPNAITLDACKEAGLLF